MDPENAMRRPALPATMVYCAACGTSNVEGAAFCAKCGAALAGGSATAGGFAMSPAVPEGPAPGRIQEPVNVLVLSAVTLTVYFYIWLLRVTGEVDAYVRRPGWSRSLAQWGTILAVVGLVASLVVGVIYGAAAGFARARGDPVPDAPAWVPFVGLVGAAGTVLVTLALSRVWTALAEDARAGGRPPVNPQKLAMMSLVGVVGTVLGIFLGFVLPVVASGINSLFSVVGLVLWFIVLHRTQTELNLAWRAAQQRGAAHAGGQV